jgi:hypothetical protein
MVDFPTFGSPTIPQFRGMIQKIPFLFYWNMRTQSLP